MYLQITSYLYHTHNCAYYENISVAKCNLTWLKTEMLVFLCIKVLDGAVCLAVSALMYTCIGGSHTVGRAVSVYWLFGTTLQRSVVRPLLLVPRP